MAETVLTIRGDSASAVKAAKDAVAALNDVEDQARAVEEASIAAAEAETAARNNLLEAQNANVSAMGREVQSSQSMAASSARLAAVQDQLAKKTQQSVGAIGAMSTAIGAISPAAGQAAGVVGSLGGVIGNMSSLLSPTTALIATLGLAVGVVAKKFSDARQQAEETRQRFADMQTTLRDLKREYDNLNSTSADIGSTVINNLSQLSSAAAEAIREVGDSYAAADLAGQIQAFNVLVDAEADKLFDIQENNERLARDARRAQAELESARSRSALVTAAEMKRYEESVLRANTLVQAGANALLVQQRRLREFRAEQDKVERGLAAQIEERRKKEDEAARQQVVNYSEIADRILLAAVRARDLTDVMSRLGSGGVGRELARSLGEVSDEALRALGATRQQIEQIRSAFDATKSGGEALRDVITQVNAQLSAQASVMDAVNKARAEMDAHIQRELDAARELARINNEARIEQEEWLDYTLQNYQERLAYEESLLESAQKKIQLGQILNDQERKALEDQAALRRTDEERQAQAMEQMRENMSKGSNVAAWQTMVDLTGDLTTNLLEVAFAGADAAEEIPKSFIKAIGGMAAQMGSLAAAQALMFTFTPGMQGHAAPLWGAAAAFSTIAAAAGFSSKQIGKRKGGSSNESMGGGTSTTIVESSRYAYDQAGIRARDYGAAKTNADRLHIDRGQRWV